MTYKFFEKNSSGTIAAAIRTNKFSGVPVKSEISEKSERQNQELDEDLHQPIIRKFEKRKAHSSLGCWFRMSKFNKSFWFLLCVIDIYSKFVWVVPLKDKKGITVTNDFQKVYNKSWGKWNKIWVDKSSEFYNKSMKS